MVPSIRQHLWGKGIRMDVFSQDLTAATDRWPLILLYEIFQFQRTRQAFLFVTMDASVRKEVSSSSEFIDRTFTSLE